MFHSLLFVYDSWASNSARVRKTEIKTGIPVMQWRLGAARRIQALIFSTQSQARRIQALFSKIFSDFGPYLTFKRHSSFRKKKVQLQIPITAYKSSSKLYFSSLIRYLALGQVSHLQTLYITNVFSEEEPRHFLIYHYITEANQLPPCCMYKIKVSMKRFVQPAIRHRDCALTTQID